MTLLQRSTLVTAMLAALALPSLAQTTAADAPAVSTTQAAPHGKYHRPDPQKREARMEKRLQALKTALKLNNNQEAAWTTYTAALKAQRPAHGDRPEHAQRPDRQALAAMTTPERIDAMQALHTKRQAAMQAHMDARNQATKTFYAVLSPEQQKTFDAETLKMHDRGHRGEGRAARTGQRPALDSK